jgi:hypothetical protein
VCVAWDVADLVTLPTDLPPPGLLPPSAFPDGLARTALIRLVAPEEVHFGEASRTCIVDNCGEQDGRGIPPAAIGEPGALIQAHPSGYLERCHRRDHQVAIPEFMDDHLIGRAATSESSFEAIEDGEKAGAVPHWDWCRSRRVPRHGRTARPRNAWCVTPSAARRLAETRRFRRNCECRLAR